jgi:hypothetical protein
MREETMAKSEPRPKKKRPSQRSLGLVDRAMYWHLSARTVRFHGGNASEAQRKLKDRALRARRRLLGRLAELEALAAAAIGARR